ncbi:MAG: sulfatase-like hydrolase/transferase, partial [Pseudomonadota bacterium]
VGGVYFLFTPLGGLVAYVYLFNATKPSALLLAGHLERATALLTLVFFAFACATALTVLLSAGQASSNSVVRSLSDKVGIALFAALSTVLTIVVLENFSYTMFRIGIKNTESIFVKSLILVAVAGAFYAFLRIGPIYRRSIARSQLPIANVIIAIASVFALFNLSGPMQARAGLGTSFLKDYNIVLLSSDGISAKRMSFYGYDRSTTPFLDSIKHETLVAQSHYANNGQTTGSVVSLLTGMLPTRSKVIYPPDSLSNENAYRSLPRLVREQGYYANNIAVPHYADASEQNMLEAFDTNNNRSMISSSLPIKFSYKTTNWLFDRLVSGTVALVSDVLWLGEMPNPYAQVDGQGPALRPGFNDLQRLRSLLADLNRTDRPFFINSHFMGTHGPNFNPQVVRFSKGQSQVIGEWSNDHYDDSILTFDAYVRRVYERLEANGLLNKTIVVITSDHANSHEPRFKIPLIIRFPNGEFGGTVIRKNTQTVDVNATLIDYLGGEKPDWMDGSSIISKTLPANRFIFSTGVSKMEFAPSIGSVSKSTGRYGSIDHFYMMHCDMTYMLNVNSTGFQARSADDPQQTCNLEVKLSKLEARTKMLDHLRSQYE